MYSESGEKMTGEPRIISPMATGNGAYVLHRLLEKHIQEYRVSGYNPYWTLFPFALSYAASTRGADLIHTAPDYAKFFYRKSVPLVVTFHNYVLDRWMKPYSSPLQKFHYATDLLMWTRMVIKKTHTITAVSHFLARMARRELNLSCPIQVIYNGVDVNQFSPVHSSRVSSKEVRVFFSGNLTRRKGARWLPSISKQLSKNVHLYYTQGLRTRNIFPSETGLYPVGSVHFEDMPDRYNEMDILLMPSVREGFGLAIAEAMACGLPVVASNCSAIPELIDDGKGGFLCPVGEVETFAEKINLLADSPTLRREMGEYNRSKVERYFTVQKMVKKYDELFEEILN